MTMIQELEKQFTGIGEVKGFEFTRITSNERSYMYEVRNGSSTYYEVFIRKASPVCLNFAKREYSDSEFKEIYPKSNSFGVWAWWCKTYDKAIDKMNSCSEVVDS